MILPYVVNVQKIMIHKHAKLPKINTYVLYAQIKPNMLVLIKIALLYIAIVFKKKYENVDSKLLPKADDAR